MRTVISVLFIVMMATVAAAEDEVKLKNGDRISGKVTGLAGGKLTVETPYAGKLTIDWTQVVSVKTDGPLKLTLVTGELLEGKVEPGAEGRLKVATAGAAAPVEVDLAKIKAVNEPPIQWHGALNAAGKVSEGNTRTKSFLVSAEAKRESEQDVLLFRAIFHYGETSGVLTERNSYGMGKYQYKVTPNFYGYLSEELEGDTFKDIGVESITSVGAGYNLVKESWMDFSAEAGVAYFDITHQLIPDDAHLGARVATNLRLALPLGFEFKDLTILYPNFKDSQNFQLRNEATLGTALGAGWNLLGGVITEYSHKPSPGLKDTDDTYWLGLGYTF